jgi:ribosomal protein S18 acetylase RimI-like enzyme
MSSLPRSRHYFFGVSASLELLPLRSATPPNGSGPESIRKVLAEVVVRATIRQYCSKDMPALRRVALEAWKEYAAEFGNSTADAEFLRYIASLAGEVELMVADAGGRIVGFVGYTAPYSEREPMFPPDWAVIQMLSISPRSHDRDLDRRLSESCILRARRDKATAIALHPYSATRSALPLYLRLGFVLDRCTRDRNGVPGALFKLPL